MGRQGNSLEIDATVRAPATGQGHQSYTLEEKLVFFHFVLTHQTTAG